ncbi:MULTISPECIES: helix-turn-helix domain-containing protein [Pseudomonas]|jgi:DNA-binding transcriptional MerR regulator|uniref:Helix-turn-helix domain-containing protein n=1 Tax=Pseudomonas juntendi TaxID=2666183 RepID=A0A7W2LIG0_9PSED|nr:MULTISPECIES: helix-turn-helix domain-containing protein [Pseudomonas]OAK61963.1 MerR family transcriptional regulator [Pseudomonas putida]PPB16053.1 MerR family DNA-binding transcriptional regulator [Pseudomonas aeruginosa]EGB98204.1 MerR family transcriptional regulator [Pseudomonas sp. TJI-51]MBA6100128.1 helix-turn-helix domain-containing protein [Pseudomonas juntendi]MBA6133030.1 helix-turn-helix domain-containing protein [Pseudomonas juntendi]
MDIADVAKRTGVPASTLRYYEKKGLLKSLAAHGQRRQFAADVTDRLALIALGQAAGFSLDEMGAMLVNLQVDRQKLLLKADELDARIRRLQAMSKGLRHAAQCPEEDHLACPKFQRLMKLSAVGALGEKQDRKKAFAAD